MRPSSNAFHLYLLTVLFIFVLSSCMTNSGLGNETTTTIVPTSSGDYGINSAQEAVEAYYKFMSTQEYAEAYQMLSPSMPHRKSLEEFVLAAETFYESYKLISIESYPVWVATLYAGTPAVSMPVENDRCKRFIVEVEVEYKEGQMGAGPSGTYPYALTIIKDEDGWKLVQIDTIPDPYVCGRYK